MLDIAILGIAIPQMPADDFAELAVAKNDLSSWLEARSSTVRTMDIVDLVSAMEDLFAILRRLGMDVGVPPHS